MKRTYATIAGSTLAALLLTVGPVAAGDGAKKAEGGVSTDTSTSVTTDTKIDGSGTLSGGAAVGGSVSGSTDSSSASPKMDDEKKTGLDRADQKAGEHGQQGRDNAREQQESKDATSASPRMDDSKKDASTPSTPSTPSTAEEKK